ncbi:MAG: WcaI family glycosyltransferase [Acidobacteriota bacterium]|nr:WcaI family glycosyltransferase [Acidobacteriota bacterium]
MRILIYGLNYTPELTGIGKYTGEMAAWLASRGHQVRVVTAPPYYPAWRVREDYRGALYRTERTPGGPVVRRTPLYVPQEPSGIKRVAHLVSFMIGSIPVLLGELFHQPDLILTVEPTFFGAPLALLFARAAGIPAWLHVQDFEIDAAFDLGLLPAKGFVHQVALSLERVFACAFDRVSTISTKMRERAHAKGVPPEHTTLFPNWVDIDLIRPLPEEARSRNPYRCKLALTSPGTVVVLYSGNMGAKQGLELLAPVAESFESDLRVHFLVCGDGAFRSQLETLLAGRSNVTLLPLQPLEQLNDLLNAADIHLLPQRAGAADIVMPSRLTGMLSSGRPVVATADAGTQVAQVVGGSSPERACGIVVAAEDPAALYQAVSRLVDDPEFRLGLGRSAREYAVEHLGKQQVLERFEVDLKRLLQER